MPSDESRDNEQRQDASAPIRLRAEGRPLNHEKLLRFMVESVHEYAIFSLDADARIASWNPGAARIFGYEETEILGQSAALLFTPEDRQSGVPAYELATATREGRAEDERWHQRRDGSRFWASGCVCVLLDSAGLLRGFVKVCRDKTAWKLTELHNLELLAREQEARKQAETASRLKDEFLATVSHELRTPLSAILGWADVLSVPQPDAQTVARAVEVIRRNAKAQKQLVEDLLDVSRITSGKLRLDMIPLEVEAVVRAAVDAIRLAAHAKAIELSESLAPDAGWVMGDAERLQQIFWNLLSNAVKFTPKGGRISVRLHRSHSSVELVVMDTGKGISAEFIPNLFERFRQADGSTSRAHTGLGLGLALARHLTELHGGTIRAESDGEGKGSTFTVVLPMSPLRAYQEQPETWSAFSESAIEHRPLDRLRLLIVDDEPDAADFLALMLRQRGAAVVVSLSADEALDALQRERPDVLISDIGMPYVDGYTLIRKIRSLPPDQGGETPAIALTAYAREQDRVGALLAGFQSHAAKPVKPGELVRVVARLAGRLAERQEA